MATISLSHGTTESAIAPERWKVANSIVRCLVVGMANAIVSGTRAFGATEGGQPTLW